MKGLERRLFVAISLILVFGMVLSICKHDWQYLERTGSLIILVAIGLGWKDLVTNLGKVENLYRNLADRKLAEIEAEPDGLIYAGVKDKKRDEVENGQKEFNEVIVLMRLRLRRTEVGILCFGTVLWGYGTPLANLLWSWS